MYTIKELADLAHSKGLPLVYDIGSGLLRKPDNLPLADEPDVRSSLEDGADLVTFSGDKLLGGPQAGIIAGKSALVSQLAQAPMMRALRVGKLTIAALHHVIGSYLNDQRLRESVPIFSILEQTQTELRDRAEHLAAGCDFTLQDVSVSSCLLLRSARLNRTRMRCRCRGRICRRSTLRLRYCR